MSEEQAGLAHKLDTDLRLRELHMTPGHCEMAFEATRSPEGLNVIQVVAEKMVDLFKSTEGAYNYCAFDFVDRTTSPHERYQCIIQRTKGLTPSAQAVIYRRALAKIIATSADDGASRKELARLAIDAMAEGQGFGVGGSEVQR